MEVANDDTVRPGTLAEVILETVRFWMRFSPSPQEKRVLQDAVVETLWT